MGVGRLLNNYILNYCILSLYFFYLFETTGIKRTADQIGMKFGMRTWDGCGVVISLKFYIFVYLSIFLFVCNYWYLENCRSVQVKKLKEAKKMAAHGPPNAF